MMNARCRLATNGHAKRYVQILKRESKASASESGILQMKLNKYLLKCKNINGSYKWSNYFNEEVLLV